MSPKPFTLELVLLALLSAGPALAEQVVFSKIMYAPAAGQPQYLELRNLTATPFDLANWRLSGGVEYEFPDFSTNAPALTFLKPFERIILCGTNPAAMRTAYAVPESVRLYGPWRGKLSRKGERITLADQNGALLCTVKYGARSPWPPAADGTGHPLVLLNPDRGVDDWRNWTVSARPGGAPGSGDPVVRTAPTLRLNEIHFRDATTVDWVEVFNPLPTPVPTTGLFLSARPDFSDRFPLSNTVAGGGLASWTTAFPVRPGEVVVYLLEGTNTVLDCRAVPPPGQASSWQAFPDGGPEWYASQAPTRDAANHPARHTDIIINEIMFDPPSTLPRPAPYLELFNRGRAEVDLSGWQLTEGVRFRFPTGTKILPGGYLVVTGHAKRFRAVYGGLPVLGDWEGKLSHKGDRLRLLDASDNLVNQVDFQTGGDWPELAAGGGSSLELTNPWLDNSLASAWRDSDETAKSTFREYSCTGKYEELHTKGDPSDYLELHLHLVGEGHLALQDLFFGKALSGPNLIRNGDQLSDDGASAKGWLCQGTHWASYLTNGQLHLVADGHGDNRPNRAEIDLPGLKKGDLCELRFKARWVSGKPRLIAQTWDHSVAGSFLVEVPPNLGTPGARNSCFVPEPPPQVDALLHSPAVPRSSNTVTVTARVSCPVPLASVSVLHRLDNDRGNGAWTNAPMHDDGQLGDAVAGDGLYTAELPARRSGRIVQFYVQAVATNGQAALLPRLGPDRPALYVVDDRKLPTDLRTVRYVVSAHDLGSTADGDSARYGFKHPRHSNHYYNSTFISNERDIFYLGGVRQSGSPWTRGGSLDRPKFKLPADRLFRAHEHFYYDNDAAGGNFHNRITRYWLYLMGLPANENEVVRLVVNNHGPELREETEPVWNDFLNRHFPHGSRGLLYRVDDEWWFTDNWDRDNRDADWSYKGSDNPGRYRTEWMLRTQEADDNYSDLIAFFKLISSDKYTQEEIEEYLDPDAVLKYTAVRGYTCDWDTFTMSRGKNAWFYQRPDDRKFMFLQWDSDLGFGDPNGGFYGWRIEPWLQRPYNRRRFHAYLAALHDQLARHNARFKAWLQAEEDASPAYSPNPSFYLDFCAARDTAVQREVGRDLKAPFEIKPLNPSNTATNDSILLTGTAPCTLYRLELAGHPDLLPTWKNSVTWQFPHVPLTPGTNPLVVRGLDQQGRLLQQIETRIVRAEEPR